MALTRADIMKLLQSLNEELSRRNVSGHLHLVGGAVLCLVFEARQSTLDVDGYFKPAATMREAAKVIAAKRHLPEDWLNDAVKGFLSPRGDFHPFARYSNLEVMSATPEYLLAMKCLALRLGPQYHDESDVRFLLRYMNVTTTDAALAIIERYYPKEKFPVKTLFALQEILDSGG